ncbi:MAG: aminotransferase class I/II-fold pyridoxal phosphate-dependent enzyme, partial [Oscillospiraceae bacterium]|nr:aminotransferase class I/II-fold pyridoxal phosphate-dependent enzyme [Oscillospiraceae bacterium]
MFNREAYALGSVRSQIRDAFEYGRRQAKLLGEDKVFDFSLGNPSIPAPRQLNEAVIRLLNTESSVRVHGYTSAPGADEIRDAVAADLSRRFGMQIRPDNLFVTCGAAPALTAVLRALSCEGSEIVAVAPFFPEYRPFIEGAGSRFV